VADEGARVVCLDRDWEEIGREREENPESGVRAENLAYVIYASGVKGVAIPHRAITRLIAAPGYIETTPSDRVAQVSSLSLDRLGFEIWSALLHGATLVVIVKDPLLFPKEFAAQISKEEISALLISSAIFNYLAREAPLAFGSVKRLLLSGETADPVQVAEVLGRSQLRSILNVYGPTEYAIFSTWRIVEPSLARAARIPIRQPVANTHIHILGANLEPAPVGVPGLLYIGGDGIGRGYHQQPEPTAEAFVPDPFSRAPGARLYKTGDRGCRLSDGSLEYLGRVDRQVKIRGFNVELGEIEGVLGNHPSVREAVVVARDGEFGDQWLVAYLVAPTEAVPTPSDLRRFVRQRLPDYMLPAAFIFVAEIPRLPDGQVDEHALPTPETARPELEAAFAPPRNHVEEALARIWSQVFGLERVGIHDNFFHLGGHSLLATQVIARASDAFQMDLPLRRIFEAPTIASFAEVIMQQQAAYQGSAAIAISRVNRGDEEQLLAQLDQLSDEEVNALLTRAVAEESATIITVPNQPEPKNRLAAISRLKRGDEEQLLTRLDQLSDEEVNALLGTMITEEESK